MGTDRSDHVILLASDHNGVNSKRALRAFLKQTGNVVVDMGPDDDLSRVDYVDFAHRLGYAIEVDERLRGILICGTGVGMSIAANRHRAVKASLVTDVDTAKKTREHNDSNVLVMGEWRNSVSEMEEITAAWLGQDFGGGRHVSRVAKLDSPDRGKIVLVPGIFEILHPGHLELFKFASHFGRVVAAVNSDLSAEQVKRRSPLVNQATRLSMVRSMAGVDEAMIFDGDVGSLSEALGVTHLVKGGDTTEAQTRVTDRIGDHVEVKILPLVGGFSTSAILDSARRNP